jgi:PAS domain S-box-containing protein
LIFPLSGFNESTGGADITVKGDDLLGKDTVRVLIVDDNEGDALLIRQQLARSSSTTFVTDWAPTYQDALLKIRAGGHEVCLIDYTLDEQNGLALIQAALKLGSKAAMIMLTGTEAGNMDAAAIESGAIDYLVKGKYDAEMLDRVIRHSLHRFRLENELRAARDNLEKRVETRTAELCEAIAALQQEIDQRETIERQLRETEERYRIIFEEAMDAIILISIPAGAFVDFNSQAFRQLDYTREEFRKLTISDIEARETPEQSRQHIERILNQGAEVFESLHRTRSGQVRNILVSARPILLSGTKYILALFHDFTERKQTEDDLRSAVIRLEQNNQAKSEFVANVSHELKTPLTSMMYGVRNLLKGIAGPLPDHAIRYLKLFDVECQRLVATINDILDLGKLDNQSLTLSPVTAPLGHLVRRCLEALRPQADAAGIMITSTLDPRTRFVRCDPNMIQRVLYNILGNAVKFTPPGGTITLSVRPEAEQAFARITVTDTGIGIPPDAMDRVTQRYFRASNHASGSGLGLAISKEIILLHGGTLTLASPPPGQEKGTEISLTLPLGEPPTILVADNDTVIQNLLKLHLTTLGYRVITTESGQETILTAEASRPDLILLDLILEDINGVTVILTLRGSPTIRYIPIIAITGATLDESTSEVLSRFSIPTLPKPWNSRELTETIESALLGMTVFQTPSGKEPSP